MENIKNRESILVFAIWGAIFVFIGGFLLGILSGSFLGNKENKKDDFIESHLGQQEFINPLLACDIANGRINKTLIPFKSILEKQINQSLKNGQATHVAVYFRDLNSGPWIGINEKEEYTPASLLKVPLMMAYFKKAEKEPSLLAEELLFVKNYSEGEKDQSILPSKKIEIGKKYRIDDLIERAIIYSDNQAAFLLLDNIEPSYLVDVYKYLSIDLYVEGTTTAKISVRSYSAFFIILFNASYLNLEYSEKALQILSRSEFRDALVAGVPGNIGVAHKFGEGGDTSEEQFHDCGIIYFPQRPYLLCIMTRGQDAQKLKDTIKSISSVVYNEVYKQLSANNK